MRFRRRPRQPSIDGTHRVNGHSLVPPWPEGMQAIQFGMGCFWNAERLFWGVDGVWTTAVGFHGDHTEVVRVVFDPTVVSVHDLMTVFWANHDPAAVQSSLYASVVGSDDPDVLVAALASVDQRRSVAPIRTVLVDGHMTYAGPDQQQYLA